MIYVGFRFLIGMDQPVPKLWFPAELSYAFVLILFFSDLGQDFIMGSFMMSTFQHRFSNIFWQPWHSDIHMTLKVGLSQTWAPTIMIWVAAPYIACSSNGEAFLNEMQGG